MDVPKGVCYGCSDVPVAPSFRHEAEQVAQKLGGITFDKVYSSPLSRATLLAQYCGFDHPVIESRISEVDYGRWELRPFAQIPPDEIQPWYDNWRYVRPPMGESFHDQYLRVSEFIDELKQQPYRTVAAFCHGGVLICAAIYAGLFAFDGEFTRRFDYGDILTISL